MADWRDRLRPASFRGVPFRVDSTEGEDGRALALHVYPTGAPPFAEDLGELPRRHLVDAYLVGDDFMQQRDRLLEALRREGSGELVHPYLGRLEVAVEAVRFRHSAGEGRLVRVAIVFVETAEAFLPETFVNPAAETRAAAAAAAASSGATFQSRIAVLGAPDWVKNPLLVEAQRAADAIRSVDLSTGAPEAVAAVADAVDLVGDAVLDKMADGNFVPELQDALAKLEAAFTSKYFALQAFLHLDDTRCQRSGFASALGEQADENALAVERLLRELALGAAVRLAALVPWASQDDALAARDQLAARLEDLSLDSDDDVYQRLLALRAALVGAVPPPEEQLPRLERVAPPAPTSSLLLAWRIFGDLDHEAALVARNEPPWPGFLSPSTPLEVLVDPG